MSGITLGNLRDWHSCLDSIAERMRFGHTQAGTKTEMGNAGGSDAEAWDKTNLAVAEGMLSIVVREPQQAEASLQLAQFAIALSVLQPDPVPADASKLAKTAYAELWEDLSVIQRGLPAIVETFRLYGEGRCRLEKEPTALLDEAVKALSAEPNVALGLVAEAGCLCLRGLSTVEKLSLRGGMRHPNGMMGDWLDAVAGVIDRLENDLGDFPLEEVELVRDRWRAPGDEMRVEYRTAKLTRLGVVEPEIQALVLSLYSPDVSPQSLVTEHEAIVLAGAAVVPGLIAIASDVDSRSGSSISGGEAAIRAVDLLRVLRAVEAVPAFLRILQTTQWNEEIHEQVSRALEGEMLDVAFPVALEAFDQTTDVNLRNELSGILAKGGRGKPGVFERLIGHFRATKKRDRDVIAGYLAELGDPRALPDLHQELYRTDDWMATAELEAAIVELGGELTSAEKRKIRRLESSQMGRYIKAMAHSIAPELPPMIKRVPKLGRNDTETPPIDTPATVPVTNQVPKVGRNDPCPCGSGKKYKKCHGR